MDQNGIEHGDRAITNLSRRDFLAMTAMASVAAFTRPAFGMLPSLVETNVSVQTPDGTCDAVFIYPSNGSHPGVLIWTDVFGLRPSMRDIGKRIAADGYSVLVPNPYYRVSKAPEFETASTFNLADSTQHAKLQPLSASLHSPGAVERDAVAYTSFLDAQPQVDKRKKMGTQGYCMGGPLAVRTAAAVPDRIGACASFHGGGLVTDRPDSPHLLAPKIKAQMYFAIASNDDQRQPDAKDTLREAFAAAHVPAEIEVYPAKHGWCVPDMPTDNGVPIYSKPDAERAWGKLVALYKLGLV